MTMRLSNKKAFMYTLVFGVIGLLILLLHLYGIGSQIVASESFVMGQAALEATNGLHDRELAVYYFDVASQHAAYNAVVDTLRTGAGGRCDVFGDRAIWYDRGIECFPTRRNLSTALSQSMETAFFSRQTGRNPYMQGSRTPRDFVYYSEVGQATAIEGYTAKPILMTIRCNVKKAATPIGFGYNPETKAPYLSLPFYYWTQESQSYACGQIALRPSFRHAMNVSTQQVLDIASQVQTLLADKKCDGDVSPSTCLKAVTKEGWKQTITDVKNDQGAVIGALALYEIPIGDALPGMDAPPLLRFGIRVRQGSVQPSS